MLAKDLNLVDQLERARHLDRNALGQLHDLYYPEVYRYIYFRLGDEQESEELASRVFLQFLEAIHRKREPKRNLIAWMLVRAGKLVDDCLRMRAWRSRRKKTRLLGKELSAGSHWDGAEGEKSLPQLFQRLPLEQQHLLALRFVQGRSLDDLAEILGQRVDRVRNLQLRALEALQKILHNILEKSAPS